MAQTGQKQLLVWHEKTHTWLIITKLGTGTGTGVSFMVYQPGSMIWLSQKIFPTSRGDGEFPKGSLPISKEVNRKKSEVEGACLAPASGYGQHFTKINYLYTF
ncbi:neuronal regeneration-related protein isoform X2 [Aphelocoma coerulescens]|uniref:neuronal regeneration-related protein isoform X2 n=1 Tax=Aphelocoma coerulescens TaxID=39617 RepID=UPI003604AE77